MRARLGSVPTSVAMALALALAAHAALARPQGGDGGEGGGDEGDVAGAASDGAEEPPGSRAEQLFKQGLDDMLAGRYERGCPALAESYRLDPLPGALFTLAECQYKWGRLATAYENYQGFLSQVERMAPASKARQKQRAAVARKQLEVIEPDIPTLTIRLPPDAPSNTLVRRGDAIVPPASLGQPLRVDPGRHTVTVEVPNEEPRTYPVSLNRGENYTLDVKLSPGGDDDDDDDDDHDGSVPFKPDGDAMRVAGAVFMGVGALGAIVGTSAGVATLRHKATIDDNCSGVACNREGLNAADSSRVTGAVSTAGVVIGGVGLAAGLALWLLAPTSEAAAAPAEEPAEAAQWRLITDVDPLRRQGIVGIELPF